MTATATYSVIHEALTFVAREHQLVPFDVRLLLAIYESGGTARTDELERDMRDAGSAIRRSSLPLRRRRFLTGAAVDGSPRVKRGVRASFALTARGRAVAEQVLRRVSGGSGGA